MRCTPPARRCALILTTLWLLVGCQTYQPRPLDLQQYAHDLAQRSLQDPLITEAAARRAGPVGARGEAFDPADGLTLREAELVALVFNAQLRAERLRAQVPRAGAAFAGRWADPELEVDLLRILEGVDRPWIAGVGFSLTVPLSGRLRVEEDQAWAEADHAWLVAARAEWALLESLRVAWAQWSAVHLRQAVLAGYLAEAEPLLETVGRLVEAGEVEPASARLLAIDAAQRRLEQARLEAQEYQARLGLYALLGLPPAPPAPPDATPDTAITLIPEMPAVRDAVTADQAGLLPALAGHPDLLLAESAYARAELALERETVKQHPDLQIGPRYEDEEGQSRIGLGFGLPVPLWNRNQGAIAEARAARDAAAAEAYAVVQRLMSDLAQAQALHAASDRHARQTRAALMPLAETQLQALRGLAELGEVDVLLLREALAGLTDARLTVIDAVEARALAAARLQSMTNPRWAARPTARPSADQTHTPQPLSPPADAGTE